MTHDSIQFIAFYDSLGRVVLGKRVLNTSDWEISVTGYTGNVKDAHNTISIMTDGEGYLHISWDHHNNPLNYAKSKAPFSLVLGEKTQMTGDNENTVSYPEFYKMPDGDLLFLYRDGASGSGNLILNRYLLNENRWERIQTNLIDGEGERNAYWQCYVDHQGHIHLSWVWRETWDVATNHDLCYAVSHDGGHSWKKTSSDNYQLPINQNTAEVACRIPQNSELINQTSMHADESGQPYIATYWKEKNDISPQYKLIYFNGKTWKKQSITSRETDFSLSGGGTKAIPISRPQIIAGQNKCYLIFRDVERGNKVSVATTRNIKKGRWEFFNATDFSVDSWEPTYDTELWKQKKELHLFVQKTGQGDGENLAEMPPQMISVLELK